MGFFNQLFNVFRRNPAAEYRYIPRNNYNSYEEIVRCPRCGSIAVESEKQGYNFDYGCLGYIIFGFWGWVFGMMRDKGKVKHVCHRCGHSWMDC